MFPLLEVIRNWLVGSVTMRCCGLMLLVKIEFDRCYILSVGTSSCWMGYGVLVEFKLFLVR